MFSTIKEKWQQILLFMKNEFEIMDISFNTWLAPLKPYALIDDKLYIIVSEDNEQIKHIIKKK